MDLSASNVFVEYFFLVEKCLKPFLYIKGLKQAWATYGLRAGSGP